jgi:hypothetical protein
MIMENLHRMAKVLIFGENETHYTKKLFKVNNLHVAYKIKYTSQPLLQPKHSIRKKNNHNHSGIYQLTCLDCGKIYIYRPYTDRYS